jgi:hypothetical protein
MVTTTLCTAEALGKLKVADDATLMSDALTLKACVALADPANEISLHADTVAATLLSAAAHRALAVALSWSASAVKLTPVMFCTLPSTGRPLAKPGREMMSAVFSATRVPHWTPPTKSMVESSPATMTEATDALHGTMREPTPKLMARRLPLVATRPSTSPLVMSKV